jgi:hypothetical protein
VVAEGAKGVIVDWVSDGTAGDSVVASDRAQPARMKSMMSSPADAILWRRLYVDMRLIITRNSLRNSVLFFKVKNT